MEAQINSPSKISKQYFFYIVVLTASLFIGLMVFLVATRNPLIYGDAEGLPIELAQVDLEDDSYDATEPIDLQVVNVTDSSAAIFFRTKEATSAYVQLGQENVLDTKILDVRDSEDSNLGEYYNHYFEYSNPSTEEAAEYVYRVLVGADEDVYDNAGQLYSFNFTPLLDNPPTVQSMSINVDDFNRRDTFVMYQAGDTASTVGVEEYLGRNLNLSLGTLRAPDLESYIDVETVDFTVYSQDSVYQTEDSVEYDEDQIYRLAK